MLGKCPGCGRTGTIGETCPHEDTYCFADASQVEQYQKKKSHIGRVIDGKYGIIGVLGRGGMGWVYEALRRDDGARIALKVLRADHADDQVVCGRFFREAKVLALLQHPNLVRVYDSGVIDGEEEDKVLYISMELLRGRALSALLRSPRWLSAARIVSIGLGIARGLSEAHRNGVVHRDLKPDNVLLVRGGDGLEEVKVVDFGIARLSSATTVLTQTGMVFGTPVYMSPEQALGQSDIGPGADIYAFGVLLFQMLTGTLPYDGEAPLQILMAHVNKRVPPICVQRGLSVPGSLVDLTYHCLQKEPGQRPVDGDALAQRLSEIGEEVARGTDLVVGQGEVLPKAASLEQTRALVPGARRDTDEGAKTVITGEGATVVHGVQGEETALDSDAWAGFDQGEPDEGVTSKGLAAGAGEALAADWAGGEPGLIALLPAADPTEMLGRSPLKRRDNRWQIWMACVLISLGAMVVLALLLNRGSEDGAAHDAIRDDEKVPLEQSPGVGDADPAPVESAGEGEREATPVSQVKVVAAEGDRIEKLRRELAERELALSASMAIVDVSEREEVMATLRLEIIAIRHQISHLEKRRGD